MLKDNENTYLAKWLNNELNAEDLEELKQLPEYEDYDKIITGLTYFKAPDFDAKKSLNTTLEGLDTPTPESKTKVIPLKPLWYALAVAASIALIIGIFFNKVTYTALPGEQLAVVLPDGSSVDLNAASTLSHSRFFWSQDRKVDLKGEAFFKVTSGTNFTVETETGKIEVLGTQFNVRSRNTQFLVGCYEGKVRVSAQGNQQKVLQKGQGVILENKKLVDIQVTQNQPLWTKGESLFDSVPLSEVLDELERQFDITITRTAIDQEQLFTGGFVYDDLTIALESVLVPMGIEYVINGKTISLSTK